MSLLWDQRNNPVLFICGYYLLFVVLTIVALFLIYCSFTYWTNSKDILAAEERYLNSGAETQVSIDKHMMLDERDLYPDLTSRNGLMAEPYHFNRYPNLSQIVEFNARQDSQASSSTVRDMTRLYV
ncbi:unnamed protein product [Kluyveromyces dobzhanskii CBS 2104]|uniref:WGS project CCBQ000000000 data, contig 00099 n=1 Tax=Kluyveromyces dobzhanskii CBS 2104 TaxID=1427455 RepID=A0A0A8L2G1_9SACH|nr:unnamed protein product [Kluyveromyces dobzhanskii CBS 2104]